MPVSRFAEAPTGYPASTFPAPTCVMAIAMGDGNGSVKRPTQQPNTTTIKGQYSPSTDDLEVVLNALVVDKLARLEVGHGNLGVTNGRADGRHGANAAEERRGRAGRDHDGQVGLRVFRPLEDRVPKWVVKGWERGGWRGV